MIGAKLLVARHGQPSRRIGEYGLSLEGREEVRKQAQELAFELGNEAISMAVHASPARRTFDTGILFAEAFKLPPESVVTENCLDSDRVWPDQEEILERVRAIGQQAVTCALIVAHAPEVAWLARLDHDSEPPYGQVFEINIDAVQAGPEW
jgi:phosphohistidine phosphatase SixA